MTWSNSSTRGMSWHTKNPATTKVSPASVMFKFQSPYPELHRRCKVGTCDSYCKYLISSGEYISVLDHTPSSRDDKNGKIGS